MATAPNDPGGFAVRCAHEVKLLNRRGHAAPAEGSKAAPSGYVAMGVVAAPLVSPAGELMGVCELLNRKGASGPFFSSDDELLLTNTLRIAALDFENLQLKADYDNLSNGRPRERLKGASAEGAGEEAEPAEEGGEESGEEGEEDEDDEEAEED